jgi:hypothetical protein
VVEGEVDRIKLRDYAISMGGASMVLTFAALAMIWPV